LTRKGGSYPVHQKSGKKSADVCPATVAEHDGEVGLRGSTYTGDAAVYRKGGEKGEEGPNTYTLNVGGGGRSRSLHVLVDADTKGR